MARKSALLALAVGLMCAVGFATAQWIDFAGSLNGCVSLAPAVRSNTAANGSACDVRTYTGAALVVGSGVVDNVAGSVYVVLQDSVAGSAWTALDSVAVDSVDNKYYDLNAVNKRDAVALRAVYRGSAGAADTLVAGAIIQRRCSTRPC